MKFPRIVYAIKHQPTGKVYVGSTSLPKTRITNHLNKLSAGTHNLDAMQADYNNYGGNYSLFILDVIATLEDCNKEYLWMDILKSRDPEFGYNGKDHSIPLCLEKFKEYPLKSLSSDDEALNRFATDSQKAFDWLYVHLES